MKSIAKGTKRDLQQFDHDQIDLSKTHWRVWQDVWRYPLRPPSSAACSQTCSKAWTEDKWKTSYSVQFWMSFQYRWNLSQLNESGGSGTCTGCVLHELLTTVRGRAAAAAVLDAGASKRKLLVQTNVLQVVSSFCQMLPDVARCCQMPGISSLHQQRGRKLRPWRPQPVSGCAAWL